MRKNVSGSRDWSYFKACAPKAPNPTAEAADKQPKRHQKRGEGIGIVSDNRSEMGSGVSE